MTYKEKFKVGDRVKFRRSHDKTLQLEGTVERIHDNADDCVDVKTIPDGRLVEVETLETVHAGDCVLVSEVLPPEKNSRKAKKSPEGENTGE